MSPAPAIPPAPDASPNSEAVLLEETADLVPEDAYRYGRRTVSVRTDAVTVSDAAGTVLLRIPMASIRTARTESLVGGACLEIVTDEGLVVAAAFTASKAPRFSEMARGIEQLAKGEPLSVRLKVERTRCAQCNRLLPEKDGRCPACVKRGAVLRRILGYMAPYRWRAVLVGTLAFANTVVNLATPWFTRQIMDGILLRPGGPPEGAVRLLLLYVAGILATLLISAGIEAIKGWNVAFLSGNIAKDLRAHIYRSLEHLQLSFFDKKQLGAIVSRVSQDTDRVWGFLVDGLPFMATAILTLAGVIGFGLTQAPKLTLAILSPVPVVVLLGGVMWKPLHALFHKVGGKWGRLHTQLNESMNGIRVVKAFAREEGEWAKFTTRNNELAEAGMRADRRWYVFNGAMIFLTGLGSIINWVYGGMLVLRGEMTVGTLGMVQMLLWQVYGPLQWFSAVNQWFSRAMAGAERVFEVIDSQPEAYERPDSVRPERIAGRVTFENVRFGYDKSNPVLKGIDLDVAPGEMIGLVGRSGAGKSTTVNLLCRFYEADSGTVRIDGIDITQIDLRSVRRHIGIVLQEPFLFNGTIAENIAYGKPDASFEEILAAARAACAHEFIVQKPDGYDTQVGEKGGKLSCGEKQRISIARAILHDPRILILDEATSSVDVETEKKIQQALGNLTAGRTTFAIAHRLSTLRNADRLVVIEKGRIVEVGTHAELMERKGVFHSLVETQARTSKALSEDIAIGDEEPAS
ncbi:MAG: ABC transporter ATP-binding protein [Armatimonadota bacterium]